jgi:PrtD family type I secretion system ABC transporter
MHGSALETDVVMRGDPIRAAIRANKSLFLVALGFSAGMSILALTTSFYMLQVYDRVLPGRSEETLLLLTLIAVGGICAFAALDSLRARLLLRAGMRISGALAEEVLHAMVATACHSGSRQARAGLRDVESLRNFIASPGFAALLDAPFVLVYLLVLALLHPLFPAIVIGGGAILVLIALASEKTITPLLTDSIRLSIEAHAFAEDGLRNAPVLEGMGMSPVFVARWHRQWLASLRTAAQALDRDSRLSSLSKAVRLLLQIALLGVGALLVLDFGATGGVMIAASIIGARALAPVEIIVSTWKNAVAARQAAMRLTRLMQETPGRSETMSLPPPSGRLLVAGLRYAIGRKLILSDLDFAVAPGESLGIIGPSASGKSSLLRLLVGAWPASSGSVRLDGADIHAWPRQELGRFIGYLPQDVELFSGTIRENIARMTEGEPEAIVRAARRAHAHEMILALPQGYDTQIGENGHDLSGGQAQRIGIARALYGEPRLVVLDEPNANLDGMGEAALLTTVRELKQQGVTLVVVAHRPGILLTMDKMLVMRANGTIEAFGPRAEIMQRYTRGSITPVAAGAYA